jgi:hypothetical protein
MACRFKEDEIVSEIELANFALCRKTLCHHNASCNGKKQLKFLS